MIGRTSRRRGVLVLVFFGLVMSGRVFGWGNTWMGARIEELVTNARWRLGALRGYAAFRLDNAGYDSDVFFGAFPNPVPDYQLGAGVSLRAFLPLNNRLVFDVLASPRYLYYRRTKDERVWNQSFRAQGHLVLKNFYFNLCGGHADGRDRLSIELPIFAAHQQDDVTGAALCQLTKAASLGFQYRGVFHDYENRTLGGYNIREALNRKEDLFNLDLYIQKSSRTRFFIDAEYGSFVFTEAATSEKNSRSYGLYGGVDFIPPPASNVRSIRIQGRLNLGFKSFDVLASHQKDYRGLVGSTSITLGLTRFIALRGSFLRDIQYSAYADRSFYLMTLVGGGASYSLSRRVNLNYDLTYMSDDNLPGGRSGGDLPQQRFGRYRFHSSGINIQLGRKLHRQPPGESGAHSLLSLGRFPIPVLHRLQSDLRVLVPGCPDAGEPDASLTSSERLDFEPW